MIWAHVTEHQKAKSEALPRRIITVWEKIACLNFVSPFSIDLMNLLQADAGFRN